MAQLLMLTRLARMRRRAGAPLAEAWRWALGLVSNNREAGRRRAADLRDHVRRDARSRM